MPNSMISTEGNVEVITTEGPPASTTTVVTPPQQITVVPTKYLESADTRKDRALAIVAGGGVAMTIYAAIAMYLVRFYAVQVFWLGLSSLAIIAVIFTGILGLLVKRSLNISKQGIVIEDANYQP